MSDYLQRIRKAIADDRAEGLSDSEIAEKRGITETFLRGVLKETD